MKRLALWEDPFGLSPLRQGSAQASISQPFVPSLSKAVVSPVEPDTAGMLRMPKPVLRKLEGPVLSKAEGPDGSPFDALRVSG
jgi:hypothetical protein